MNLDYRQQRLLQSERMYIPTPSTNKPLSSTVQRFNPFTLPTHHMTSQNGPINGLMQTAMS